MYQPHSKLCDESVSQGCLNVIHSTVRRWLPWNFRSELKRTLRAFVKYHYQLTAAFFTILIASSTLEADDTEIYFGNQLYDTSTNKNILFVLDTSGSMDFYDPGQDDRRIDRLKSALHSLIDSTANINIGLMRFNGADGGSAVIHPIKPIDSTCQGDCGVETSTWTYCARENETCSLTEASVVRYGSNGRYFQKSFSGGDVSCSNAEFGDPIGGFAKACEFKPSATVASPPNIQSVRESVKQAVDGMTATGGTPIVGAFYEAAQYLLGGPVYYGLQRGTGLYSPSRYHRVSHPDSYTGGTLSRDSACSDADLDSTSCDSENIINSPVYVDHVSGTCQTSNIILLSDGEATSNGAESLVKNLIGVPACNPDSGNTACGVELAYWLDNNDHAQGTPLNQNIRTYTIGFNTENQLLQDLAAAGGGTYYDAASADELARVFEDIIGEVLSVDGSFLAPGTAVSQYNRLTHRQDIYYGLFKPASKPHWAGNLKRYAAQVTDDGRIEIVDRNNDPAIDPENGFFSENASSWWDTINDGPDVELGGAANQLSFTNFLDGGERRVYTYLSSASAAGSDLTLSAHRLHESNTGITSEMLDATSEAERDLLLKWARGVDTKDYDSDLDATEIRLKMGDALHSNPLIVDHANGSSSTSTIFIATNEGLLHAVDGETGKEVYAFMPEELLANIKPLAENKSRTVHPYGLDGDITLWHDDVNSNFIVDSGESAYLFIGARRGGSFYYALDISNRTNPNFLWKIEGGQGDYAELAQTWSRPVPTTIMRNGVERDVLIFGGGYDAANNDPNASNLQASQTPDSTGAAVFIVDAETGAKIWSGGGDSGFDERFPDMNYSIPADIRVVDVNSDGMADQMYVGDMGGQLWRFDFEPYHQTGTLVYGGVIAKLNGTGIGNARRFYNEPDVAIISQEGERSLAVSIGSGWRAHPLNTDVNDRFYMIRQTSVFGRPDGYGKKTGNGESAAWKPFSESDLSDVTDDLNANYDPNGWFIDMEGDGEKVLGASLTVNNQVIFTSYQPDTARELCIPSIGSGSIYVLDVRNGSPTTDLQDDANTDLTKSDRKRVLKQGGIPPPASALILEGTRSDGSKVYSSTIIAGTEQVDIDFNLTRRTYWQDRGQ